MELTTCKNIEMQAYHFHWTNSAWATVILGDPEFVIISDHGTWGHIWNARGKDVSMMQFVCQCDDDYLMKKLSDGEREFDHQASMDRLDDDIREWLEINDCEDIDDLIAEVNKEREELNSMSEQFEFDGYLMDSKIASEVYDGDSEQMPTMRQYPQALQNFVKHYWTDIKGKFQSIINRTEE